MAAVLSLALVLTLVATARSGAAQAPDPSPSPAPAPSAGPTPDPSPAGTIAASVEPTVERYLREHSRPCSRAEAERVPCFPVSVEEHGPVYSVADSLTRWKPDTSPGVVGNNMPTSPYGTPVAGVSFDPVCAGKSLLKGLRGKNDTYYLYRVWDGSGEHAVLRDAPIEPGQHLSPTPFEYELIGKIDGECEAVAAWRKANREAEERNQARAAAK